MAKAKSNKVLIVKNVTREGPGLIQTLLEDKGIAFDLSDLARGEKFPAPAGYRAVIVLGGPDSANDPAPKIQSELKRIRDCLSAGIPFLGICLGMQLLVKAVGGDVIPSPFKEAGFYDADGFRYEIFLNDEGKKDPLFEGFPESFLVFQLHGETVRMNEKIQLLGQGRKNTIQAVRVGKSAYGLQSHSELTGALLEKWAAEDTMLSGTGHPVLWEQYRAIEEQYTRTGHKLFGNFLTLAGF